MGASSVRDRHRWCWAYSGAAACTLSQVRWAALRVRCATSPASGAVRSATSGPTAVCVASRVVCVLPGRAALAGGLGSSSIAMPQAGSDGSRTVHLRFLPDLRADVGPFRPPLAEDLMVPDKGSFADQRCRRSYA
jgi:hypothetical protein